jgi:hypothetical protein
VSDDIPRSQDSLGSRQNRPFDRPSTSVRWTKAKTVCASGKTYLYCHPLVVTSMNSRALSKVPLPVKLLLKVGTLCSDVELNVLATTVNDPGGKIIAIVTSQPKIATILSTVATRSILGCSSTLRSV